MAAHIGPISFPPIGRETRPFIILSVAALVFMGGCVAAVVRESLSDRYEGLERSSDDILEIVVRTYGSDGGSLSLTLFIAEPDLLRSQDGVDGRTGRASLEVEGGGTYIIHFPDRERFERTGTDTARTNSMTVPVRAVDGSVVPGRLEVVVVG